jgi:hypothetical protein
MSADRAAPQEAAAPAQKLDVTDRLLAACATTAYAPAYSLMAPA